MSEPYQQFTRTQIERGDSICIRWRIARKQLERLDSNYYNFGSRKELLDYMLETFLTKMEETK